MAIVGHFENLAEAQKLVQSKLLAGVVEETIEEGQLLPRLPVVTINSKTLLYNRESTLPSADFYDIHEQIPWTADVDYATQVEVTLKRVIRQDILDNFMLKTYKDPNDYKTQIISELRKGCMRTVESTLLYGDATGTHKEFDGLMKLCAAAMKVNEGSGALSLANWRQLFDTMKLKPHQWLTPHEIARRVDAAYQEAAIGGTLTSGLLTYGKGDAGAQQSYFMGIPIVRSDYMTMTETAGGWPETGGATASILGLHFGQIMEGGICLCTGGDTGGVDFFNLVELDELEDYDAGGIRLVAYCALANGSTKSLGLLHSITDAAVTA